MILYDTLRLDLISLGKYGGYMNGESSITTIPYGLFGSG
jgi:hypothetical protein